MVTAQKADTPHGLDPYRWTSLAIVVLAMFMALVDVFIVNVAGPKIQSDLHATSIQLQLVFVSYTMAYGVVLMTGGRLGDRIGRKKVFLAGMAGFTLASAACAISPNPDLLILFRVIQGFGASLMVPQVFSIIQVTFPPEERQKALGAYGAAVGLASVSGQILGGVLSQYTWRAVFLVNVPIGVAAFIGGWARLRESKLVGMKKLDIPGMLLLAAALSILVYLLMSMQNGIGLVRATGLLRICSHVCGISLVAASS